MKNKRSSKGIWIDVCLLVVCLAVITSCISSGMFAKYSSQAGAPDMNAEVASFDVDAELSSVSGTSSVLEGGGNAEYTLKLKNLSQVAVSYSVTFTFDPQACGLLVEMGGESAKVDENGIVSFSDIGVIDAGDNAEKQVAVVMSRGDYTGSDTVTFDFTAKVKFTQID